MHGLGSSVMTVRKFFKYFGWLPHSLIAVSVFIFTFILEIWWVLAVAFALHVASLFLIVKFAEVRRYMDMIGWIFGLIIYGVFLLGAIRYEFPSLGI